MKGFSGIKDVDMKILMELGDEDLYDVCQTDKRINDICNDDTFWMRRTIFKTENIVKPENMSWRQYYWTLTVKPYLSNFEELVYIKENAKEFFKEANLGLYNGIPLNDNLTEIVGIGNRPNLYKLFYHYFQMNNISRVFRATDLMNKYFDTELTELEADGKFNRNNFGWNKVGWIIEKLILKSIKPLNMKTMKYVKMKK